MPVLSVQIDTLRKQLGILEAGLRKYRSYCLSAFELEKLDSEFVAPMIKSAESKPPKHPRLQRIYRYCQRIAEKKEEMSKAE